MSNHPPVLPGMFSPPPDAVQRSIFELEESDRLPIVDDEDDARGGSIQDRAGRFDARNPHVFAFAVRICRYLLAKGITSYGIGAVWEIMRFRYLETTGDIYKLNNNHRAFYARKIMAACPDLATFFKVRDCPNDPEYHERLTK